jgi:hypothetical protein
MPMDDPKAPIYQPGWQKSSMKVAGWISALLAITTAAIVVRTLTNLAAFGIIDDVITLLHLPENHAGRIALLAGCWAVFPPIWFFFEYFWLYRGAAEKNSFDLFKHGQQTAIAIWAGVSVALGGLAVSDFVKPKDQSTFTCTAASGQGNNPGTFTCIKTSGSK